MGPLLPSRRVSVLLGRRLPRCTSRQSTAWKRRGQSSLHQARLARAATSSPAKMEARWPFALRPSWPRPAVMAPTLIQARPVGDHASQGATSEGDDQHIGALFTGEEFQADRCCTLAGVDIEAVLDQKGPFDLSELAGEGPWPFNVIPVEVHRSPQRAHAFDLQGAGGCGGEDGNGHAASRAAVGKRLAKIPGARAYDRWIPALGRQPRHNELG